MSQSCVGPRCNARPTLTRPGATPPLVRGRPTTGLGVPLRPVLRSRLTGAAESDLCRKTQPPELSVVAEPDLGRETRFLRAYGAVEADLGRETVRSACSRLRKPTWVG